MKGIRAGIFVMMALLLSPFAVEAEEEQETDSWIRTDFDETNGLPTGEANAVLQTSDGYIWIGSYGGLIRYDGEHFLDFSTGSDGWNDSGIRTLFEDSQGRLYIGTNDRGVYLYEDGEFQAIPCRDDSESFYSIRSFAETSDGTVYAGTTSGLARIDETDGMQLLAVNGTEGAIIYDLTCDNQDVLWGCSDEGRILVVQDDQLCEVIQSSELMDYECYSLLAADDGALYLGTSGNEIVRVTWTAAGSETENGNREDAAGSETENSSREDAAGSETENGSQEDAAGSETENGSREDAAGSETENGNREDAAGSETENGSSEDAAGSETENGSRENTAVSDEIAAYRQGAFQTQVILAESLHTINKLYEDRDGTIWILASNGMGYIGQDDECYIPDQMDQVVSPGCMIQDYEGNLWMASSNSGVSCFSKGKYYNYNRIAQLEGTVVNAIYQYDGYTYLGTDSGLIILDENFSQVENRLTEELETKRIRHITGTSDGMLWFSAYGTGLVEYDPDLDEFTMLTSADGLQNNEVRLTLELQDGSLAVAGTGGIDILKDGAVEESYGSSELPYPFILCMYQAEDGTLVAGSDGQGIYEISDGTVTQYYQKDGLESGSVMRMVPDEEEQGVWISAGASLYFRDEDGIREIPLQTGSGSVLDIQMIGDKLWMTKSNGLVIADKTKLKEGIEDAVEIPGAYGLTGTLTANSWNYLTEDGSLWLCTYNGISMIDTDQIPVNSTPPKSGIESVQVDDETYRCAEVIEMPSSAKRITLNLAVLSYTKGDKYIEYYLEGFDDETYYSTIAESSQISYTNLSGGEYAFHLKVFNEDGTEGESCSVILKKELCFWETAWFVVAVLFGTVVAACGMFYIFYRLKVKSLKKRQAEYRSIIDQSLRTFANAIDAKDKDTNGHSVRVAAYSRELARRLKLPKEEQEKIYYMALLHDIGKIGIPDHILKKNGKLTQDEWEIVKSHPVIGAEILKEFTAIPGIADGARYHHEHYDGKGYCEGLKGEEIPRTARIIAVADAFDAMCSKRYYHEENTTAYAKEEIARCSGAHFDPEVAACMIQMIEDGFGVKQEYQ